MRRVWFLGLPGTAGVPPAHTPSNHGGRQAGLALGASAEGGFEGGLPTGGICHVVP